MGHVRPGSIAKKARRQSALERLEDHLKDHMKSHKVTKNMGEDILGPFESHNEKQKEELKHLRQLLQ